MKDRRFYGCQFNGFTEQGNLVGAAVTGKPNRVDEVLSADAISTVNYMRNPVILYAHDWHDLPIGKTVKTWKEDDALWFEGEFADHEKARLVKDLYAKGFLNAFSIGFLIHETKMDEELGISRHTKAELLEISSVPVPADANALQSTSFYSFGDLLGAMVHHDGDTGGRGPSGEIVETRTMSAIPYKKTPLADEGEDWDAAAEVGSADVGALKIMCAWYDAENPDVKSSYKLPHHKAASPHSTVWRAVAAAGAAIQGSRGGVNIPAGDVGAVKSHLAKHYREFDKTPPWEQTDLDPQGDSVWNQSARRMEHLIKEIRNGKRENPTDVAMLREICQLSASLAATSKQSGAYIDAVNVLVRYLGDDQFYQAFVDLDKVVGSLMPERIPPRILEAMSQAKLAMKQVIERGK